jgi:hypothetical protein
MSVFLCYSSVKSCRLTFIASNYLKKQSSVNSAWLRVLQSRNFYGLNFNKGVSFDELLRSQDIEFYRSIFIVKKVSGPFSRSFTQHNSDLVLIATIDANSY